MKFQIEKADTKHVHAVTYFLDLLEKEHQIDGFDDEQFIRFLFDPQSLILIATTMEEKAIGFIHARNEDTQTIIHHLYVDPEHRSNQVEQYLVEMTERWASSNHHSQIISPNNLEIFKQMGYQEKLGLLIKLL